MMLLMLVMMESTKVLECTKLALMKSFLDASTTTGSFLDIVMHEATHITQYVTGTEIESISGGTPKLFDALPANIKKSLVDYISSNFPISYGYLKKERRLSNIILYVGWRDTG